jgi:hypothetical protein
MRPMGRGSGDGCAVTTFPGPGWKAGLRAYFGPDSVRRLDFVCSTVRKVGIRPRGDERACRELPIDRRLSFTTVRERQCTNLRFCRNLIPKCDNVCTRIAQRVVYPRDELEPTTPLNAANAMGKNNPILRNVPTILQTPARASTLHCQPISYSQELLRAAVPPLLVHLPGTEDHNLHRDSNEQEGRHARFFLADNYSRISLLVLAI